jgi:hypothetical protein
VERNVWRIVVVISAACEREKMNELLIFSFFHSLRPFACDSIGHLEIVGRGEK